MPEWWKEYPERYYPCNFQKISEDEIWKKRRSGVTTQKRPRIGRAE